MELEWFRNVYFSGYYTIIQGFIYLAPVLFNTWIFLAFFAIFYITYWVLNGFLPIAYRNVFILFSSYVFYGYWDYRFLALLVFSSGLDFFIGKAIYLSANPKYRKKILYLSIFFNLGLLSFFKYCNFFIEGFIQLIHLFSMDVNVSTLNIILPVGLSFYTFQSISYTIDVYKKRLKPEASLISFFAYISFFPQLVAGPIERASKMLSQFNSRKQFTASNTTHGLRLLLWGFFKKVIIADNCGLLADQLLSNTIDPNGMDTVLGTLLFGIQIYGDFSGYSDMALGLGRLLGFDLSTNFKVPYLASSLREFWTKWHITLSQWFRDYVYFPLGGSRQGSYRTSRNLLITFLLSGLWHGTNATFAIWGLCHGIALVLERHIKLRAKRWLSQLKTFAVVMLFWLPFRAQNIEHLGALTKSIFTFSTYTVVNISYVINTFPLQRLSALGCCLILLFVVERKIQHTSLSVWLDKLNKPTRFAIYYCLLIALLLVGSYDVKPNFIYFQF
jgi:alginate O-acetyltransferase complex protein AlgI